MCSIPAVIVGAIGVGAAKKGIDAEKDAAKRRAAKAQQAAQAAEKSMAWWNRPNVNQDLEGRYRLNRDFGASQMRASRGVSQLRIPSRNAAPRTTGKQAQEKRIDLGIT